jgi:glycosyltransferase involved in cell wall biosynthesis
VCPVDDLVEMTLSVLYLHPISAFSGASRSLRELLGGLPESTVKPFVVLPRGQGANIFEMEGYSTEQTAGITQYDCTRFGHYRGLRWLITLRELALLPATVLACFRARRRWRDIDLIHANEITAVIAAVIMKALFQKPLVVHVRSVQQVTGIPLRRWLLEFLLRRYADAVIAIDETVRESLPADIHVDVVHNSYTPHASSKVSQAVTDLRSRFHKDSLRVGMVGNLLALKGVYEFLEAARLCVARGVNADFVLVGSNPRRPTGLSGTLLTWLGFSHDLEADIARFAARNGLDEHVHRLGFTPDVQAIYQSIDLLCFPSHLDAVGRPVIEAAWYGVPSLVAVERPRPDTLVDGETGLCIPSRDPEAMATLIGRLCSRRDEVTRMGKAARALAETNFDAKKNGWSMLGIYQRVVGQYRKQVAY